MSGDFPFKMETLLEQCGNNKDIGQVVLDEFLIQVETDSKELETCFADGDLLQMRKVGHRLKGTAGVLGAEKLYALCFAVETAGKAGNAEEAGKILHELKAEINHCVASVPEARARL